MINFFESNEYMGTDFDGYAIWEIKYAVHWSDSTTLIVTENSDYFDADYQKHDLSYFKNDSDWEEDDEKGFFWSLESKLRDILL